MADAPPPWSLPRSTIRDRFDSVYDVAYPVPPGALVWPHVSEWTQAEWWWWCEQGGMTAAQFEQFWLWRYRVGVAVKESRNPEILWRWLPIPQQVVAETHPALNVLAGGAGGFGKSVWLRHSAYRRAMLVPEANLIIVRKYTEELRKTHLKDAAREQKLIGFRLADEVAHFPNGSIIFFGHCNDWQAWERHLSTEYDGIYLDELATLEQEPAIELMSRARSTKPGVRGVVRAGSNPGGAHTRWLEDFFITHRVDTDRYQGYHAEDYAFVPARLWDNPYLMEPDGKFTTYLRRLGNLTPARREAMIEGRFGAIEGQFFPEWGAKHLRNVPCPSGTRVVAALDWGYMSQGYVCLVALLPDGHWHVAWEWAFKQTLPADVAGRVKQVVEERGWTLLGGAIDPNADQGARQLGESVSGALTRHGLYLIPAPNKRELGWARLRVFLHDAPDGIPWLTAEPSCTYLAGTLPSLVISRTHPDDCNTEGDDHAGDALRYIVAAWHHGPGIVRPPAPPPGSVGALHPGCFPRRQPEPLPVRP